MCAHLEDFASLLDGVRAPGPFPREYPLFHNCSACVCLLGDMWHLPNAARCHSSTDVVPPVGSSVACSLVKRPQFPYRKTIVKTNEKSTGPSRCERVHVDSRFRIGWCVCARESGEGSVGAHGPMLFVMSPCPAHVSDLASGEGSTLDRAARSRCAQPLRGSVCRDP